MWWFAAMAMPVDVIVRERGTGDPVQAAVSVPVYLNSTALAHLPKARGPITTNHSVTDERGHIQVEADLGDTIIINGRTAGFGRQEVVVKRARTVVYLDVLPNTKEYIIEGRRTSSHPSRHSVDGEMAFETPGNREDAVRLVQSLPGVAVQREYSPSAGTLSIRGSAPHDSRYFLDGIEVPYLYHFNQYASVFPASQLSRLDLYSSTFGPSFGDATGAIVDATSRTDAPKAFHGSAFVNFVVVGGQARVPLGKGWWMSIGGRRSYQDVVGEQTDQFTLWPVFSDSSVQVEHGDESRGTGFFFRTASDRYTRAAGELDLLDPFEATITPQVDFGRGFMMAGAKHHWQTPTDWGRAVVAVVTDRLDAELTGNGAERQRSVTLEGRVDQHHRHSSTIASELGANLRTSQVTMSVSDPGPARILASVEAPGLARGEAFNAQTHRTQGGIYGALPMAFGPHRLVPSLRADVDSFSPTLALQPRLSGEVQLTEQSRLSFGVGRYVQRPPTEHVLQQDTLQTLPSTTSLQAVIGLQQNVDRVKFRAEAWVKSIQTPLIFPIDDVATVVDDGWAAGAELSGRYHVTKNFFAHGWFGVMQAKTGGVRTSGDQPISAGLVASWDPSRSWNVAARYRMGSGLPFTPIADSVYDASRDGWIPVPAQRNSERMPFYQKVDLRAEYTMRFRRWSLSANAELWYVPKRSTQLYPAYTFDYRERTWVRGPSIFPLGGLRARW